MVKKVNFAEAGLTYTHGYPQRVQVASWVKLYSYAYLSSYSAGEGGVLCHKLMEIGAGSGYRSSPYHLVGKLSSLLQAACGDHLYMSRVNQI